MPLQRTYKLNTFHQKDADKYYLESKEEKTHLTIDMPFSNSTFNGQTTGQTVASEYAQSIKDKIILITGANPGGIGESTAVSLAREGPKTIVVAGRSLEKLSTTEEQIRKTNPNVGVEKLILDLSSQDSCRKAAQEILDSSDIPQIDLLVNNAGVMNIAERTLSVDGVEMQFATNHIGHFLFTNLLMPKLLKAAGKNPQRSVRILNLSSRAVMYGPVRFSDWNFTKRESEMPEAEHATKQTRDLWSNHEDVPYFPQGAYGQSKSANVLFTKELNKRLFDATGIMSVAVHPGIVQSNLDRHIDPTEYKAVLERFGNPPMKDLDQGCSTTLVAALDPKLTPEDFFVADCQFADWAPKYTTDEDFAARLWTLSEGLVRQQFLN